MSYDSPGSGERLFLRDEGRRAHASGLPADVLDQAARRLQVLCLLYAFVFTMARFFPLLFLPGQLREVLSSPLEWGPPLVGIGAALGVAVAIQRAWVSSAQVLTLGLGFEVVSSFGIAASEFLEPSNIDFGASWIGFSWVAVWVLLFAVVVPNKPFRSALAALVSVSSVPLVVTYTVVTNDIPGATPFAFFFGLVFPYLLVTLMAWVGASVLYSLGREVAREREMGAYRLVERLGIGGMGEVWRAEHRLLARPAAIKLVLPETLGASDAERQRQIHERFGREARATALMRSPHTVELYDFGIAHDGTCYYVMELLEGFDLKTLVERFGPVPPERAVAILAQACHSLGEAHAQGLIHRDIKPANLYVCRYGREVDFVKVLDFGMVKSQRAEDLAATQLSADHAVWGTPAFMSPEQVLGGRTLDGRADLYALGCLAYWLVTGQLVFPGRTAMEIMMQHTQADPPPPSSRTEIEVPAAFDRLVLDCLAKDPDDRPASADAVAERLGSIPLPSPWTAARASAWWNQHQPPPSGASTLDGGLGRLAQASPGGVPLSVPYRS